MGKKVLVIKHGALGDMVFADGAFQAIRKYHSKDRITLLTTSPYANMMKKSGYFDDVWVDNRPRPLTHPLQCWQLFQKLRKAKFDRIYDLQKSKRTKKYMQISDRFFKPKPEWCTKHSGAKYAYTDPSERTQHIYDRHAHLLAVAGVKEVPKPNLDWMKSDTSSLGLPKKYFIFVPGCSPTQPHKRWKVENYGDVGNWLIQKKITPVLIGTKDESDSIQKIQSLCPQALSLEGKTTLFDIAELGRHATGALGHDTGPMHIVAATGCPSVMLFSWSSIPEHYAPRGFETTVIHQDNLDDISVDQVIELLKA